MPEFIEMEGFTMINLKKSEISDNSEYSVHHVKKKIHKLDKKKLKNTFLMTFNFLKNIPTLPKNF